MIVTDGVIDRHTTIEAGTRVCFIVVEPDSGRSTVLNEPGPQVTADETNQLLDALRGDCAAGDLLILSGSLPDSIEPTVAGQVVAIGRAAGARTVVDIHSAALRIAAAERPWMLKCNRRELLELLDAPELDGAPALPDLAARMQAVRAIGIEIVVVTLGAEGALLADAVGIIHASAPAIEEVNPTGSGDLLLAGLAVGIERGERPRDAIALGVACGTAGATQLKPELPPDFDPADWIPRVTIEHVEPSP